MVPLAILVPGVVLVLAAAIDLRTREIPDTLPLLLLGWAIASRAFGFQEARWLACVLGFALGLAIGLLAFRLGALGGGDGKLLAALGAAVGPLALAIVLAWTALVGGMLALVARHRGRRTVVYGPAIAFGYVLALWLT